MPQRPRKSVRKAPAKKPADPPEHESPPDADDAPAEPTARTSRQRALSPSPEGDGEVIDSGSSTRTDRSDNIRDGERHIATDTVESRHTTIEYEHGRRVEETVTVTTNRRERIPLPYAGPVSSHPAPVG